LDCGRWVKDDDLVQVLGSLELRKLFEEETGYSLGVISTFARDSMHDSVCGPWEGGDDDWILFGNELSKDKLECNVGSSIVPSSRL